MSHIDTWATARNTYIQPGDGPATVVNPEALAAARERLRLEQLAWWRGTAEILRQRIASVHETRRPYYQAHLARAEARIAKLEAQA